MLEGPNLSGQLSDWSINDLLQIMQVTKKTGSLDINGERRGRVHFVDGAVTGAELSGERGRYQGSDREAIADILYVLSTLETGSFGVGAADGPDGEGFAVEDIMDEVSAIRSLEAEVIEAGLFEAPGVKLVGDLGEPITMEPEDWQVIVSLVQPFSFDLLESRLGRGGAVRIFHTLNRLGVVELISGDDESEWLDQLAGGLSRASSEPMWLEQASQLEPNGPKHIGHDSDPEDEVGEVEDVEETEDEAPAAQVSVDVDEEPDSEPVSEPTPADVRGVAAHASTTLTDGVYDEIRRLRSKVSDGK
jgi:hypothetical protein